MRIIKNPRELLEKVQFSNCASYSVFFFCLYEESAGNITPNSIRCGNFFSLPLALSLSVSLDSLYSRYRPVRTQTTGYLDLQSCVRYVTFAISAGTNREDDRFPSERRRRVSAACLHPRIYVCTRKCNNALTTLADSPGEAQIRCPLTLSLPLSLSRSRWYPIKQYQFIASPRACGPPPLSSPPRRSSRKFLSPPILGARSLPRGARQARTFSRNSRGTEKKNERKKRPKSENAIECVTHSRTKPLPPAIRADLSPRPANFCPCHVETCFRPTRRRLLSLSLSLFGTIEGTSLSLYPSCARLSPSPVKCHNSLCSRPCLLRQWTNARYVHPTPFDTT